MAEDDKPAKFAKEVFKKSHKGRMHRALGVPEDETIPATKWQEALAGKHGAEVQRMAQGARNAGGG
jgi:hypothetical protein